MNYNNRKNVKYMSCRPISDNVTVSAYGFNASENRVLCRPLSGGVSIGNFLNMYGTLGGLFRDNTDGTIVGLTCRHVCDKLASISVTGFERDTEPGTQLTAPFEKDFLRTRFTSLSDRLSQDFPLVNPPRFIDQYENNYNKEYNELVYFKLYQGLYYILTTSDRGDAALATSTVQSPIYQPGFPIFNSGEYEGFVSGNSIPEDRNNDKPFPYTIGHVKRAIALQTDDRYTNAVDSAIIAIEENQYMSVLDKSSCNFIGLNKTGGISFASTEEINSITYNTPLFKTGAGTGPMGFGALNTSCYDLKFNGFYDFLQVEGINYSNGIAVALSASDNTNVLAPSTLEGDSGSMLFALLSSNIPSASAWKIIGQLFAYDYYNDTLFYYASRIDNIQKALNISPWDGTNISYTPQKPVLFTAFTKADAIQKLGRVCYFVGTKETLSASYNISEDQIYSIVANNQSPSFNNTVPSGLGVYYTDFFNSGLDVYVSTGYPISAIFDKSPGFDYKTTMNIIAALDRWGLILQNNQFAPRIPSNTIYSGTEYVYNPLEGIANTSIIIYLSSFFDYDGPLSNTLGYAGITNRRRDNLQGTSQYNIPYEAFMSFNSYYTSQDVEAETANGKNTFYYTALHELGHTLGVGTNWFDVYYLVGVPYLNQGFIVGANDTTPNPLGLGMNKNFFYTLDRLNGARSASDVGALTEINGFSYHIGDAGYYAAYNEYNTASDISQAVAEYNTVFNTSLTAIPVENGRGFGSMGSHWDEGYAGDTYGNDNRSYYGVITPGAPALNDELMTPQSEGIYDMPLSKITIGSLADLGYNVNYNLADVYQPTVFNVYTNGSNPLNIGFNGNTYGVPGWSFTRNTGKWGVLRRGLTYSFNLFTGEENPIYIVTSEGNTGSPPPTRVTAGITGDGVGTGTLTWTIPQNQPTGYYYLQSGSSSIMSALLILY